MIETAVTLPQVALNRTAGFLVARLCSAGTLVVFALVLLPAWGLNGLLASMAAASVVQMAAACVALIRYDRQHRELQVLRR